MRWQGWPRVKIHIPDRGRGGGDGQSLAGGGEPSGREVEAITPLIVSASRSTDIPAFYGDWFMERLRRGYAKWINPWNGAPLYVSFENARVFVFWSKNPLPFLPRLSEMTRRGYQYCVLFTLNDYQAEGLEPHVPPPSERIETFRSLSRMIGKGRVVWRWDPLLLTEKLDVNGLLNRIRHVGDSIAPFTECMTISFIDIAKYPRVARNLRSRGFGDIREFSPTEELDLAAGLRDLNRSWCLNLSACGEERDLLGYGIRAGQCISCDLLLREFGEDQVLRQFLESPGLQTSLGTGNPATTPGFLKDPGQRRACGCVVSKDIGQYATCPHLCAYCYANTTPDRVERRYKTYRIRADQGIFGESITE